MEPSEQRAGDRFAGRGLGIDLGAVRIGVALCDSNGTLATPYQTVSRSGNPNLDHQRLRALVEECDAAFVVIGVPYSLASGEIGPAAHSTLDEIEQIRRSFGEHVDVHLQDERLTSVTAEQRLTEMGIKGKRRKQLVDQIAAAVILQTWIDGETSGGSGHAHALGKG
ncbi:MAG: Holliday junction resolvase RuvX [Acidimicrobiales bacterium]|nr:Holliday junction resolvase RuvX [Acidimicrobiales bacterium]